MATKFESWKRDLNDRAEEAASQKKSSEGTIAQLEEGAKNEKFQNESFAREAADLKLVMDDPVARELYDALNDSKVPMFAVMNQISELIPETDDTAALVAEQSKISMEASAGHYRKGEMGKLQKRLKEAMEDERKNWKAWIEYANEHRAPFLGKPENGEDDFFEAKLAEEIRQKNREGDK